MKFKWVQGGILVCAVLMAVIAHQSIDEVTITEKVALEKVSAKFPVQGKKFLVDYTLSDPRVDFLPDGRVMMGISAGLDFKGREWIGLIVLSGELDYEPLQGAFYLKRPRIHEHEFELLSVRLNADDKSRLDQAADVVLGSERLGKLKAFAQSPSGEAFIEAQKEKALAAIEQVALTIAEETPVYTLAQDDVKQQAAKLLLKDIQVTDGKMLIQLSVLQGFLFLLMYGLILLAAAGLVYAMVRNPGAVAAVAASAMD